MVWSDSDSSASGVSSDDRARPPGERGASPPGAPSVRRHARQKATARAKAMDPNTAMAALTGTDNRHYTARPLHLSAKSTRQIFVERPPLRRLKGSDKWRNSGGRRGATDYWIDEHVGLRRRYGNVQRKDGRPPLKFMQVSLLRRHEDGRTETEDFTACLWTVQGTVDEAEVHGEQPELRDSGGHPEATLAPATGFGGSPASIDLANGQLHSDLLRMPRKLSGGDADLHPTASPLRGCATISLDAALAADPKLLSSAQPELPSWQMPASSQWLSVDDNGGGSWTCFEDDSAGSSDDNAGGSWTCFEDDSAGSSNEQSTREEPTSFDELHLSEDLALGFDVGWGGSWVASPATTSSSPSFDSSDFGTHLDDTDGQQQLAWRDDPAVMYESSTDSELEGREPPSGSLHKAAKKRRVGPATAFAAVLGLAMIAIGKLLASEPHVKASDYQLDHRRTGPIRTNVGDVEGLGVPGNNCALWYDGCNTCKFSDGAFTDCTPKTCTGPPGAPYCKRHTNGLECNGPTDSQCTWAVVGQLKQQNPCTVDVWDRCVGDQTYRDPLTGYPKDNELCSNGATSGRSCAPVGFPVATCTWVNSDCPVSSGPSGCGEALGRGMGAPGSPCQNNGECQAEYGGAYTCFCMGGWTGDNCELREDGVPIGPYGGPSAPPPLPPGPPPPPDTAVALGSITVQGAGDDVFNGIYEPYVDRNGRRSYLKQGALAACVSPPCEMPTVWFDIGGWKIDGAAGPGIHYWVPEPSQNPPEDGWVAVRGASPAPTIVYSVADPAPPANSEGN